MDEEDEDETEEDWVDSKGISIDTPTPDQIRQRCLEIQATWDEETRLSRIADYTMHPDYMDYWEVPMVKVSDLNMDAESCLSEVVDSGFDTIKHENIFHGEKNCPPNKRRAIHDDNQDRIHIL